MIQAFGVLLDVDVDGKMSINVSHLVFISLCDSGDQVLDDRFDSAKGSDVLSRAVVDFNLDELLAILALGKRESDGDVGEIFGEFACKGIAVS